MKKLIVLTSTFPRWEKDSTPSFVMHFCQAIQKHMKILVLTPHYKGAKQREIIQEIRIKRYRYWPIQSGENIVGGGAAIGKIKKTPLYAFKLLFLLISLFINTLSLSIKNRAVINAHWIVPQGFIAVLVKHFTGARVVVTVHGGDIFSLNHSLIRKIKLFTLKKADVVVVNSTSTKKACQEIYKREYEIIPMGVDTEKFSKPDIKAVEIIKKKYKLKSFTVIFIGRLSEEKGVIFLIDALEKLKEEGKEFKALIVGDGSEKNRLRKAIEEKGLQSKVIMTGWIDSEEISSYYACSSVFVGPSIVSKTGWREAFGLVFAESLASGTPVIGTKTGGIQDIVVNGVNGYLVNEKDADAIFERLNELMEKPELLRSMQSNASKSVDKFSWKYTVKNYLKVFNSLL